jgi:hypothetical protein
MSKRYHDANVDTLCGGYSIVNAVSNSCTRTFQKLDENVSHCYSAATVVDVPSLKDDTESRVTQHGNGSGFVMV